MSLRVVWVAALLAVAAPARAQTGAGPARVEVEVGGGLVGGAALGTADADLRANAQTRQPFRLFTTDSSFARAPALHVRAAMPLWARVALEGGVRWSRPEVRTAVSADAEEAAPVTAVEQIHQYVFDAALVWTLDRFRLGERAVPFVSGGGGYLRQLHEGRTFIEHGQVYHAGGGIRYPLFARGAGIVKSAALRADARLELIRGGISFENRPRPHAAVSGGFVVGF